MRFDYQGCCFRANNKKSRKAAVHLAAAQVHRVDLQKSSVQEIDLGIEALKVTENNEELDLLAEMDKAASL